MAAGKVIRGLLDEVAPRFDPRKLEQDKLRALTTTVEDRGTMGVPGIPLAQLEGEPFITTMSDRTRAGGLLTYINDVMLRDPVNLQGGQDFMFENPGAVWASAPGVVRQQQRAAQQAKAATGRDPLFIPWRMAPSGQDFATMSGEAMLGYAASNVPKKAKRKLNETLKGVIPNWPGIDSAEAVAAYRAAPARARKQAKQVLDRDFRNEGGLGLGEARLAVADPRQVNARDGGIGSIGRVDPTAPVIADSGHPSYPAALPGEGLGRTSQDVGIFELMPDVVAERGIPDPLNPRTTDLRALQMKPYSGVITADVLRRLADRGVDVTKPALVLGALGLGAAGSDEAEAAVGEETSGLLGLLSAIGEGQTAAADAEALGARTVGDLAVGTAEGTAREFVGGVMGAADNPARYAEITGERSYQMGPEAQQISDTVGAAMGDLLGRALDYRGVVGPSGRDLLGMAAEGYNRLPESWKEPVQRAGLGLMSAAMLPLGPAGRKIQDTVRDNWPSAGTTPPDVAQHGQSVEGFHYSKTDEPLRELSGAQAGTGARGEERSRVGADDERTYLYLKGGRQQPGKATPRPEMGVGAGSTYYTKQAGVYDLEANPLGISGTPGEMEAELKARGFSGYSRPSQGVAVMLQPSTEAVKVGDYRAQAEQALARRNALPPSPVTVTAENLPSTKTEMGQWLVRQPRRVQERYTDEVESLLDKLYLPREAGAPSAVSTPGYGAYEGRGSNPNTVIDVATPEEAKALADARGFVTRQDAVPYFQPNAAGNTAGLRVDTDRAIPPSLMDRIHRDTGLDFTRTDVAGLEFINFLDDGRPLSGLTDADWQARIRGFFDTLDGVENVEQYRANTNYNWTQDSWLGRGSEGARLLKERPALGEIRRQLEIYDRKFRKQHGRSDPRVLAIMASLAGGGVVAAGSGEDE